MAGKNGKITKAEQKKIDTANKRAFTQKAFEKAMRLLPQVTSKVQSSLKVNIAYSGWNRYIKLSVFGSSCNIMIFTNGNIAVDLYEMSNGKYREQLFEFTVDTEKQDECLKRFEAILKWLIPVFAGLKEYSFHEYMYFIPKGCDLEKAYEYSEKTYKEDNKEEQSCEIGNC